MIYVQLSKIEEKYVGVQPEDYKMIEQKGIVFDHDFSYSFPRFSSLLMKEGRRKGK